MIDKKREKLENLYKDALYQHFLRKGYQREKAYFEALRRYKEKKEELIN
ncbi:MAG: hypothetical protein V5A64_05805 [Candidatus Thermoplasmatota archaeon]